MFQLMLMEQKRRFSARLMNSSKNIRVKIYATRSFQMSIKCYRKRARQEKKSNVMLLTVDEIGWEEMMLSGKIEKMYVAQLDMYLTEKIGMSLKEIKTKGFTLSSY